VTVNHVSRGVCVSFNEAHLRRSCSKSRKSGSVAGALLKRINASVGGARRVLRALSKMVRQLVKLNQDFHDWDKNITTRGLTGF
jgi:hypothetical protein